MAETTGLPVIEWSNDEVRAYDPVSGQTTSGRSIHDVARPFKGRQVLLALSRRSSFVRSTRLPDVAKSEMGKILALQVTSLFPVEFGEASVDFLPLDDRNNEGRLAVVAAVRIEVLREALFELEHSGLRVAGVLPTALSSMTNGTSQGAVVGMSSEGLTIDLVSQGGLRASRVTTAQTDPSMILAEVSRSFASAGMEPGPITTVGAIDLPGSKYSTLDPLAALSSAGFEMNLELPEKQAKRTANLTARSRNLALLLWSGAILAGVIVFNTHFAAQQAVDNEEAKWTKTLTSLRALDSKTTIVADLVQKQRETLEIAFKPKQPLGDVLTILTNLVPAKLWLTGVTLERGKPLTLRGTSLTSQTVTAYLASLGNQSRFRDVRLVFANNGLIEKTPVVNFSITAHLVGNFPLPEVSRGAK